MTTDTTATRAGQGGFDQQQAFVGIELGSTRIKAALVGATGAVLAQGSHEWENQLVDGNWTYSLDAVWQGLQECFASLQTDVAAKFGAPLTGAGAFGVSAMMHGYLAFDEAGELLAPFRTWRNGYTTKAAATLSERFGVNIPLRWSVAHLLHAVQQGEEHAPRVAFLTSLAGYVHWQLTGEKVLGVGDASGLVPLEGTATTYDPDMLAAFDELPGVQAMPWKLADLLPDVLPAGSDAGRLTEEGARLLDPSGRLQAGTLAAPPEGDAGTGMVATNSVRPGTGNVSAGTSAFAMVVLDGPLSTPRSQVDMVATPSGDPVAMIHTNNCTGDLNAWVGVFEQFAQLLGAQPSRGELFEKLFRAATGAPADAQGLVAFNYLSGEHQTGVEDGRPMFVRGQDTRLDLPSFMRGHLNAAFAALACGMEVLLHEEEVPVSTLFAHGGIFSTQGVAQQVLADALDLPVSVGTTAGEGGAWGMALLAAYAAARQAGDDRSLPGWLAEVAFAGSELSTLQPDPDGVAGYARWLAAYRKALPLEQQASQFVD